MLRSTVVNNKMTSFKTEVLPPVLCKTDVLGIFYVRLSEAMLNFMQTCTSNMQPFLKAGKMSIFILLKI